MKTYEIHKSFKSQIECDTWEETNCPDRTYNGECILMISHTQQLNGEITIDSITTC